MTATMDHTTSPDVSHEPPIPALYDLRIALADHLLSASIVFRNGEPHLLIDQAPVLVHLVGDHFAWRPADSSTPAELAGQHATDDIEAAAAALSNDVNEALVRHLNTRTHQGAPRVGVPGMGAMDGHTLSIIGREADTTPVPSATTPADTAAREFEHACYALRCGTLRFHDLSLEVATDAERTSAAWATGEALAEALNSRYDDRATAIPINCWVTAIWVCPDVIVLTDSTHFAWLQPARTVEPAKLRATQGLPNAVRLLARERTQIMVSRAPSPPT
ncbi:hypothetical protein [Nonomuraea sp. SYSU D8015]|uniref:hypothetical protein n=1 Tax=Nonomuraea sp. SYSU D8015 TaxID=2593644 RepID=UPI001660A516|nr:hypothetical protein [Nonomuraea sp. SYSU D8015]